MKVTPVTGVGRALKSRKLTPKFISPYQILKRIGSVAYQIALPPNLSKLHNVFHVSQLHKYIHDLLHVIEPDIVQIRENLTYDILPVRIGDRRIKQLQEKNITLVKVLWSEQDDGDATWELESNMRALYPHLFTTT